MRSQGKLTTIRPYIIGVVRMRGIWIRIALLCCLGLAALSAVGMRYFNEDLSVALCSGRDTVQGLLGRPDQWSFTMGGAVWVDQSWLPHLIYYSFYSALGELGPVLIKVILLVACLVILFMRCRSLAAGVDSSLAAVGLGALSLAPFWQIRAENFGLLAFLLFTMFIVAPVSWGRWRQLGCLVILAVWANSHGSFMLGVALLGLRFLVTLVCWRMSRTSSGLLGTIGSKLSSATRQNEESPEQGPDNHWPDRRDVAEWLVTFLAAFGVVGLVNPYGASNLAMPFRQLSASSMTSQSADWVSVLNRSQVWIRGFLQPLDVRPYLFFAGSTAVLAVLAAVNDDTRKVFRTLCPGKYRAAIVMEALIPLVLLVMVIRFRRLILFAGPALVPLAAVLVQTHFVAIRNRLRDRQDDSLRRVQFLGALLLSVCAAALGQQFYTKAVRPYLPGNPMREDRPLISQLMSFDAYGLDMVRFMKENHIQGHMMASWTAAAFLRFHDPRIQVFMDTRDQSFYSDEIIRNYFSVMHATREDVSLALDILDRYGVNLVALATTPQEFTLASLLMETHKWACIYKDDEFLLLIRSDAERFAPLLQSSSLDGLQYPSSDSKLTSEAMKAQFFTGVVQPDLLKALVELVHRRPDPDLYILITLAMNGQAPCLNAETRTFLTDEAQRLAATDYMVPAGALKVVKSLVNVTGVLAKDQATCRAGQGPQWTILRDKANQIYQDLEEKYRGY